MIGDIRSILLYIENDSHRFSNPADVMSFLTNEMVKLISLMIGYSSSNMDILEEAISVISNEIRAYAYKAFNNEHNSVVH